jgi:hypothetical protein
MFERAGQILVGENRLRQNKLAGVDSRKLAQDLTGWD